MSQKKMAQSQPKKEQEFNQEVLICKCDLGVIKFMMNLNIVDVHIVTLMIIENKSILSMMTILVRLWNLQMRNMKNLKRFMRVIVNVHSNSSLYAIKKKK